MCVIIILYITLSVNTIKLFKAQEFLSLLADKDKCLSIN